jgi:tRNA (guanine-N7-)-methyltransferase
MTVDPPPPHRAIRSFVKRGGRITVAQERALAELWPRYGIEFRGEPLELAAAFGREAPRVLEIGFGDGDTLVQLAAARPDRDYLGIEVHPPGVGHCLLAADAAGLGNVRVVRHDAVEVLERALPDAAFDEVLVYFADPWPKKRHHKRRLVRPPFLRLLARKMKPGGVLRLATDWEPYAEWMLEALAQVPEFRNRAADGRYVPRPPERPETKFERRGLRLGHVARDLEFERVAAASASG